MTTETEPTIKVIDIKHSYEENKEENYKDVTVSQHIQDIQKIDYSYSRFEVITEDTRKMFFNIQGIDKDDTQLILKIVDELYIKLFEFFIIEQYNSISRNETKYDNFYSYNSSTCYNTKVFITENIKSHSHEGRSYHVVFCNLIINLRGINKKPLEVMKDFINYYICNEYTGYQYIDDSIYSPGSLFRCINQPGVNINTNDSEAELIGDDMHREICKTSNPPNPTYTNIFGNYEDLKITLLNYYSDNKDNYIFYLTYYKLYNEKMLSIIEEQAKIIKNKLLQKEETKDEEQPTEETNDEKTEKIIESSDSEYYDDEKVIAEEGSDYSDSDNETIDTKPINGSKEETKETPTGEDEYNKATILLYVYKDLNINMQTALKGIKDYYNNNNNFDNFDLNLKQIQILETMIENKL